VRKILVMTCARSDYGLLYWLMREIQQDPSLKLQIVVMGMHLEEKFGFTYKQIVQDGFKIDAKVKMNLSSDKEEAVTKAVSVGVAGCTNAYKKLKPDVIVLLGDRFETFAAASAALFMRIPIAHIHGGEVTEGAYDDAVRHAITKMAQWHFVAHKQYAKRVVQLGENPKRVFRVGAVGLDHVKRTKLLSKKALEAQMGFPIDKNTALVTYHPVTLEKGMADRHIKSLLKALEKFNLQYIFTIPNADAEHTKIFKALKKFTQQHKSAKIYAALGAQKYFSLMKHAGLMIGNSSSGVIEAPSSKLPVVNIGSRQIGRLMFDNVINCSDDEHSIRMAIKKALSKLAQRKCQQMDKNALGQGNASKEIKNILKRVNLKNLKKGFYDV